MRLSEHHITDIIFSLFVLGALAIVVFGCAPVQAQVPPALERLSGEWEADLPPRVTYATPAGDEALVLSDSSKYIRVHFQGNTYAACPEQGAALFSMEDLAASADSVLTNGAPFDKGSLWVARSECISTFAERNTLLE